MGREFSRANRSKGDRPGILVRIARRIQARSDLLRLIKAEEAWRDTKEPDSDRLRVQACELRKELLRKHFP